MIAETLNHLATLTVTGRRHRRFVRSSVSLWSRAGRCRQAWAEHETRSQNAVFDAIADLKQRRTAVVLGSGLLRDVPIAALATAFDTVVLVDLVHLASVRIWLGARRLRNVRMVERDLSGYDQLAAGQAAEPLGFLRQIRYLDFVVSANLLSQIGRGVQRRLADEPVGSMPGDTAAKLVDAHLLGLAGLPCRTCLITDIAYAVIDRTGRTHEEADLLLGVAAPEATERWAWPVAPLGEESKDYQIVHQVIAARLRPR
jgi:hypothetical protein